MTPYTANTRTRRNLETLRRAGWRILLTPDNPNPPDGIRFAVDNGAWGAHCKGTPFQTEAFEALVERHGAQAGFVVVPDIVAGGLASLEFSLGWLPRLRHLKLPLLAVQDGMSGEVVGKVLQSFPHLGIFLGGSTEWKLREMWAWGRVAHAFGRHYHVARVNSRRRIDLAHEAGADSIDGSSAAFFSYKVARL